MILRLIFIFSLFLLYNMHNKVFSQNNSDKIVLAIHGGAGTILKKNMSDSLEQAYVAVLTRSLEVGYKQLKDGRTSIEAVEASIRVMEDSPLFNAGKGAVFNNEGKNELDASIMDGKTLKAGAIAGVSTIRNPIVAARTVMERSEHVMMVGDGAEKFAEAQGVEIVAPSYFWTKPRWEALQRILERDADKTELDHQANAIEFAKIVDEKFGTVGCVALDNYGNLAAGTSTGGMTNKKYGRIGDSPVIGAGNYADSQVAVSCTGWGEFYIRTVAAYDVAAQINYLSVGVEQAAKNVINKIEELGGNGGMIALDKDGNVAMPFNTEGMYRGIVTAEGKIVVEIYAAD